LSAGERVFTMLIKYFNDPEKLIGMTGILLEGVGATVSIFALTLIASIPLGMLIAVGRMSRRRLISSPISFYIYIMRGTPLMLQIMFIYFLLPQVLPFRVDRFWAVIFAFVINYAAYFAEIFRGGIQSIPPGQREAAQVLGYTRRQTFFRILLLQVVKRVLLPVTNEVITLVKDTALASTVAVAEIMSIAKKQVNSSSSIEPYIVAMLIYLLLNGIAEQACKLAERKLSYF
jgi:polar amino acid transport system permease protein